MGAACGFERSLLPRMAVQTFHETKASTRLNFVASFGLSKAIANAFAGPLADRFGRKPTLILGCLVGLPVMPFVIVAKSWSGITLMNGAFGLSQGLIGSSLFFLFIDLLGPKRRGVAVGMGECSIYVSTAIINIIAGKLASKYGYRPVPFYVATAISAVGLLSSIPLKDTLDQALAEQSAAEQEHRKKYARMMSTQPSVMDEEQIDSPSKGVSFHTGYVSPWRGASLHHHAYSQTPDDYMSPWVGGSVIEAGDGSLSDDDSWLGSPGGRWASLRNLEEADENTPLQKDEEIVGVEGYNGISTTFVIADIGEPDEPSVCGQSVVTELLDEISPPDNVYLTIKHLVLDNPSFATLCLGGMVLNFKDGFAWGSFPTYFKHHMMSDSESDLLIALYPLCWGFSQAFTGALSDKFGRKLFLLAGTGACSVAMALFTLPNYLWGVQGDERHYQVWVVADILLGLGTALVYPALQAGAADEADPKNRGIALGFYRFVRDMGYVVGAIVCGHLSDWIGYEGTFLVNAGILALALVSMMFVYQPRPLPAPVAVAVPDRVRGIPSHINMNASTRSRRTARVDLNASSTSRRSERINLNASTTSRRVRRVIKILEHRCSDSY